MTARRRLNYDNSPIIHQGESISSGPVVRAIVLVSFWRLSRAFDLSLLYVLFRRRPGFSGQSRVIVFIEALGCYLY